MFQQQQKHDIKKHKNVRIKNVFFKLLEKKHKKTFFIYASYDIEFCLL